VGDTTEALDGDLLAPAEGMDLRTRLRQVSDRAAYLSSVARTLSGALHTDRAVDLVLELLTGPVVEWTQVTILDRQRLVFRALHVDGTTSTAGLARSALDTGSSLARVLQTGSSDLLLVPDGENADSSALESAVPAPALRAQLTSLRPVDLLSLPLTARGTTYGAVTVARRGGTGFDPHAVEFLQDLAQQVAVALDTTRALADSRRVANALAVDLNPPTMPRLEGVGFASYYRVGFEQDALGGDFYDVHGDDAAWTVVMGDVGGKGVEAAVLTGKVRQSVRTAALVDRDPAAVLELTNRVLTQDGSSSFVTAQCARGRRVGDCLELEVASAGHPSPFVVRSDGSVEQLDVSGPALGVFTDVTFPVVRLVLAPGETCLFYTDGVPESPGHRSRFGEARMRSVLEATGCRDATVQVESLAVAVSTHLRDRVHDDIALLAVQAVEPGAPPPRRP
jgi:sigma-B regulation protein RsbU (phosphoserine phosphatase)